MKLIIHTIGDGGLTIDEFNPESIMTMIADWETGPPILTIAVNDGMVYIPKASVARIDTFDGPEEPETWWSRLRSWFPGHAV